MYYAKGTTRHESGEHSNDNTRYDDQQRQRPTSPGNKIVACRYALAQHGAHDRRVLVAKISRLFIWQQFQIRIL